MVGQLKTLSGIGSANESNSSDFGTGICRLAGTKVLKDQGAPASCVLCVSLFCGVDGVSNSRLSSEEIVPSGPVWA